MKRKNKITYGEGEGSQSDALREIGLPYVGLPLQSVSAPRDVPDEPMVRTQIYLNRAEHEFVLGEAARRNIPMAAVIRGFIDEQMDIPDDAWANNPMLQAPDDEPVGPEDGSLNHDHYVYGAPKKFAKQGNAWVEAAPLVDDYYDVSETGSAPANTDARK